MDKVSKEDFIARYAERLGVSKAEAQRNYNELFFELESVLKEKKSHNVAGFGNFTAHRYPARSGRSPQGNVWSIAERYGLKFTAARNMREL